MSVIDDKYTQLGGASCVLYQPQSSEQDCPDPISTFSKRLHLTPLAIRESPSPGKRK
jgi:hypothetical protein